MEDLLGLMQRIAPDLVDEATRRAAVLDRVAALAPVGRRALALRLRMPEREVRAIADTLKARGAIDITSAGMLITPMGQGLLEGARNLLRHTQGISALEIQLERRLLVGRVTVVPGDKDLNDGVLAEVGHAAARLLRSLLPGNGTLAVTGGSTMAQVATALSQGPATNVLVLPARGSMGHTVETQADALASQFAKKLGGQNKLLQLPDHLNESALREMMKMPEVREILDGLRGADMLLYAIGRADDMARRRRLGEAQLSFLREKQAVAEAFGYYFNASGHAVMQAGSVGLTAEEVKHIPNVIAVAAGSRKAEAILAVLRHHPHQMLVTDEGAAHAMLELIKKENISLQASFQ